MDEEELGALCFNSSESTFPEGRKGLLNLEIGAQENLTFKVTSNLPQG